jgi:fermentation-respiration switch protein FrsA (DUF1100 family)
MESRARATRIHAMAAIRREQLVFAAAIAAAAVAVLDDAFVRREPGTAIADHLASGLVPVAAAVGLAVAYPRLRPGLRALVAISCGSLALTAGIADAAVLSVAAGLALMVLGTATLWRSRRRDDPPVRRQARRALIAVAVLAFAYLVVLPVGFAIVATHKARSPVVSPAVGRQAEAVRLTTRDGLRLAGSYVPSRNRAAVIVFPGRSGPVPHARLLARHGYGVLLLDRRGEGASQGDYNAFGWSGEADLRAALAFLRARPDVDPARIGGLGLSVGGELLLQTAARTPALAAVVSEGAGTRSLAEQLHTPDVPAPVRWISPTTVQTAAVAVLSNSAPPPDLVDLVARIAPRPVLLIRALDGNVDEELNEVYHAAAGRPKALWEVPRGGHTGALAAFPREYERRVVGFFDQSLQ